MSVGRCAPRAVRASGNPRAARVSRARAVRAPVVRPPARVSSTRVGASSSGGAPASPPDPAPGFTEPYSFFDLASAEFPDDWRSPTARVVHRDSPLDIALMAWFSRKIATAIDAPVPSNVSYDEFIALCFLQMRGRDFDGQRDITLGIMRSLMPPGGDKVFRALFPTTRWSLELNAVITKVVFAWMVGPMEVMETDENDIGQTMASRVHIKKCRWLQESGCTAMCVNMCKTATQDFFVNDFGMPLTIKPNFEDKSCDFYFGLTPPPIEEDEALTFGCSALCATGKVNRREREPPTRRRSLSAAESITSRTRPALQFLLRSLPPRLSHRPSPSLLLSSRRAGRGGDRNAVSQTSTVRGGVGGATVVKKRRLSHFVTSDRPPPRIVGKLGSFLAAEFRAGHRVAAATRAGARWFAMYSERASALARVVRGALGVALSGAASRGPLAGDRMRAVAEMVLSGGAARRPSPAATATKATDAVVNASSEPIATRDATLPRAAAVTTSPVASSRTPTGVAARSPDDGARSSPSPESPEPTSPSPESPEPTSPSPSQTPPRRHVAVPSSPLARVLGFGQLAAGLAAGTVAESARRAFRGARSSPSASASESTDAPAPLIGGDSAFMTEANAERLAVALCRMRGAALKLGQMLSIQDESVNPPAVARALERVRQGADVMPPAQLHAAVEEHLGVGWRDALVSFSEEPLAAASIGQVHLAEVRDGDSGEVRAVCMKIQYPGVARSIHSDIDNLMRLVSLTDLIPRGLYVEHAVKVAKEELTLECDYEYERASQEKMRALLADDPHWRVPETFPELSSKGVLTTAFARGVPIDRVAHVSQEERDFIGEQLLRVTLRELFEFRFMQTDPNFANFLYDPARRELTLIDFGAAKAYPKQFVDEYMRMVVACADRDRDALVAASVALGFLRGDEAPVLIDAHVRAGYEVGLPFAAEGAHDFGANRDMTRRVAGLGKVMLKHRLTAPPEEAYSLHRKLSGCFLACMRIGARVNAREMLREAHAKYAFGEVGGERRGRGGEDAVA